MYGFHPIELQADLKLARKKPLNEKMDARHTPVRHARCLNVITYIKTMRPSKKFNYRNIDVLVRVHCALSRLHPAFIVKPTGTLTYSPPSDFPNCVLSPSTIPEVLEKGRTLLISKKILDVRKTGGIEYTPMF